jgi:hypothetical protein
MVIKPLTKDMLGVFIFIIISNVSNNMHLFIFNVKNNFSDVKFKI